MVRKVKLAVFDNDLKLVIKKYPLSIDGTKISVVSGGEAHWAPGFDTDSFLEFPKKKWELWKPEWTRIYFVKKKGEKCVNFKTGKVSGPDPEQLKEAVGTTMLGKIGQTKEETPFVLWLLLAGIVFLILIQLGVLS